VDAPVHAEGQQAEVNQDDHDEQAGVLGSSLPSKAPITPPVSVRDWWQGGVMNHDVEHSGIPDHLGLERHRDYVGRERYRWAQRAVVALLAVFVLLAALNVFGQAPQSLAASSPAASMTVSTPSRLRLGLVFQTRVDITARRTIDRPTLVLGPGWLDGMTLNSVEPSPGSQTASNGSVSFAYPKMTAGRRMTVWLEWSVNPTNVAWRRPAAIALADGNRQLLVLHPTVTVFP
jgi:hypothetical protein